MVGFGFAPNGLKINLARYIRVRKDVVTAGHPNLLKSESLGQAHHIIEGDVT